MFYYYVLTLLIAAVVLSYNLKIMEPVSEGSTSTLSGFMDRRRRSPLIRRPRDIKGSLHSFTFMPPSSDNSLKLKLKLGGGLTRTIQTNSEAGVYTVI